MPDRAKNFKEAKSSLADDISVRKDPLARFRDYVSDVRNEMKRVTWPGKQEIYGTTVMVVLTTFLFGTYFWICDQAFSNVMAKVLRIFLHPG